jgi:anti-anti-sigma factor
MSLHSTVAPVGDVLVVTLEGVVDLASVARLHSELSNALRRHAGETIVVDLDGVGALDDTALGVLLGAAASARDAGGDLQVVCTEPTLRSRLERTRFDRAVDVRTSIA